MDKIKSGRLCRLSWSRRYSKSAGAQLLNPVSSVRCVNTYQKLETEPVVAKQREREETRDAGESKIAGFSRVRTPYYNAVEH